MYGMTRTYRILKKNRKTIDFQAQNDEAAYQLLHWYRHGAPGGNVWCSADFGKIKGDEDVIGLAREGEVLIFL